MDNQSEPSTEGLSEAQTRKIVLLRRVALALRDHSIPYYLDCGTLLGCVREGAPIEGDNDVDTSVHLSLWHRITKIDWSRYNLNIKYYKEGYPIHKIGNIMALRLPDNQDPGCDIYGQPRFPLLDTMTMLGEEYPIPKYADEYLQCLYGDWRTPSTVHANQQYHRNSGLVRDYTHWDDSYKEFLTCF